MRKFVQWLYRGGSHRFSGPLTAPPRVVIGALILAYILTLLVYTAGNALIVHSVDVDLADGVDWRGNGSSVAPQRCLELLNSKDAQPRLVAACTYAQRAAPSRFDAFGLQRARERKDLVVDLATSLRSNNPRLDLDSLSKFLSEIHRRPQGAFSTSTLPRPLRALNAIEPNQTPEQRRDALAALRAALTSQISGLYPSREGKLEFFTRMRNFEPGALSLEDEVFEPPTRGTQLEQASERSDLLALAEGLVDRLRERSFWSWRLGQAVNGFIQWLTVLIALFALTLLFFRFLWARRNESDLAPLANRVKTASRDTSTTAVDSTIETYVYETERHDYELIRWLVDAIPTLGFLGTVYGMIKAMGGTGAVVGAESNSALKTAMGELSRSLGTAFDTTLVALILALIVGLVLGMTRRSEAELFASLKAETAKWRPTDAAPQS